MRRPGVVHHDQIHQPILIQVGGPQLPNKIVDGKNLRAGEPEAADGPESSRAESERDTQTGQKREQDQRTHFHGGRLAEGGVLG